MIIIAILKLRCGAKICWLQLLLVLLLLLLAWNVNRGSEWAPPQCGAVFLVIIGVIKTTIATLARVGLRADHLLMALSLLCLLGVEWRRECHQIRMHMM